MNPDEDHMMFIQTVCLQVRLARRKCKNINGMIKVNVIRADRGSNARPIDLQSIALPLSYRPG
jgi:hypothetical protein